MPVFEEDEHKCEEFTDFWIYTYGDMVTLLLTFFVLLLTFCKVDVAAFTSVAESFKPSPPGSPFFLSGESSVLDQMAAQLETSEISEEIFVTVDERGVVVSFKDTSLFRSGSADLTQAALKSLARFVKFLYALPNEVIVEGHTDDQVIRSARYPSNWELSAARAGAVARFLEDDGVKGERMRVVGLGPHHPRFRNDTPQKRALNRRIDVIIKPD